MPGGFKKKLRRQGAPAAATPPKRRADIERADGRANTRAGRYERQTAAREVPPQHIIRYQ